MQGVLTGFSVILIAIAAGYAAARFGIVGGKNRLILNRLAFFVASPPLIFTIVVRSDLQTMVSPVVGVVVSSALICIIAYVVIDRLLFRSNLTMMTLGAGVTGFSNTNNIGLPIGMYVIGDIAYIPPLITIQLIVFTPVVLAVLETTRGVQRGGVTALARALTNPIILATVAGIIVNAIGWMPPDLIMAPLDMLGGAAIPLVLLAFGASFHGEHLFQRGPGVAETWTATLLKAVATPLIAWTLAGPVLGLSGQEVFAATVLASLPSAQNMYNYAANYGQGEIVVRNVVFLTTFASVPVIVVVALLLG